ncbi:MAG: hypothetical protein EHM33_07805 [Chloroflexi bacterium]|nr:MAG: hypothetical protein EHM33_07805 [Chloroflexota bacterium]
MSQILIALSVWLHALATVILIGHYLLLSLIYIPVLAKNNGAALSEISKRSRLWLYISLLVFALTGTYLMLIDSGYLGFMNFGNFWGIVMLTKHILIFGMIALGFWFNAILRVGPMMSSNNSAELGIKRFRSYSNLMTISGILVLLLTALAQVE